MYVSCHLIKREHVPGHTVSLWKRTQRGELLGYTVMVRATSRHATTKRLRRTFSDLASATLAFDRTLADPSRVMSRHDTVDSQMATAEALVLHGKAWDGPVTLPLLFALSRVRSSSKNRAYASSSEAYCRILAAKLAVPLQYRDDVFFAWVRECLATLLSTTIENNGTKTTARPMGADTVRRRVQFFARALNNLLLDRALLPHGRAYATLVASVPAIAKDVVRVVGERAVPKRHFEPQTARQMDELLQAPSTLTLKLHLLKMLAGAFRPDETARLKTEHIVGGKVMMGKVVGKTAKTIGRVPNPTASIALRVATLAFERFGEPLSPAEREWLERKTPFPIRCLRTTMACHMLFSNVNIKLIRQRLGHTSLNMMINHYNKHPVPDVGTAEPWEYYMLPEALSVEGRTFGTRSGTPATGGC